MFLFYSFNLHSTVMSLEDLENSFWSSANEEVKPRSQWWRWLIFARISCLINCQHDQTNTKCLRHSEKPEKERCSLKENILKLPRPFVNTLSKMERKKKPPRSSKRSKLKPMVPLKSVRKLNSSFIR